jgi:phage terminase small subunit
VALTAKQEAFCEEYMIDLNGAQAAIRAGYSEDSAKEIASENLTKPNIAARIVELKAERSERVVVTADYVLNGLLEVHERCMQKEAVMERVDGQQQETGEFKFEHSGANKSLELLGKHLGMFTDKIENKHSIDLSNLSDDEVNAIASGKALPSGS